MYNDDGITEETESESSDKDFILPKRKKAKGKPKSDSLTWAEAAEIVLERFDHPLPPKEVLKLIEEADLKTDVNSSAPVAVLNSVLNNQSKGANPIFYKCPTGASSYGSIKTRRKSTDKAIERAQPVAKATKNFAEFKRESKMKQKLTPPAVVQTAARSLKPPGQSYPAASVRVKKPLIPPGERAPVTYSRFNLPLGSLSKAAYYERLKQQPQHRRMMGPTTSALVKPAPPFSRPPPGAALRVMPPKKRIKIDQDENDSDSSCQSKSDDFKDDGAKKSTATSSKRSQSDSKRETSGRMKFSNKPTQTTTTPSAKPLPRNNSQTFKNNVNSRPINKSSTKSSLQKTSSTAQRGSHNKAIALKRSPQASSSMAHIKKSVSSPSLLSTSNETKEDGKQLFFVGVKFKKMKRGFQSSKESKSDLVTPDSVLSSLQVKDLFNANTFKLLPSAYQYQLLMLLPECDRVAAADGSLRLSPYSLSNGFFSRACQEYKDKMLDGDMSTDIVTRARQEVKTHVKLDPWKVKYFEPVYGKKSLSNEEDDEDKPPKNIKPIESSWVSFLKFAENSTSDFEESLAKIQAQMKKVAEREAKEKREAERQKKEELVLRNKLSSTFKHNKTNHLLSSSQRQPLLNRSSTIRNSPTSRQSINRSVIDASKEKSKRALKRAQLLQRKKIFDKQLKDAKAKIVEEARSSARKDDETKTKDEEPRIDTEPKIEYVGDSSTLVKTCSIESSGTPTTSVSTTTTLDLSNSETLKKLITESESSKKTLTNTPQRKTGGNAKHPVSRVVHGAASFGTNSNGVCPCNVKAMFLCKQCGSAWHGDCINSDKICISCS